jgi:TM2 domain-containing membrane protein YozV
MVLFYHYCTPRTTVIYIAYGIYIFIDKSLVGQVTFVAEAYLAGVFNNVLYAHIAKSNTCLLIVATQYYSWYSSLYVP